MVPQEGRSQEALLAAEVTGEAAPAAEVQENVADETGRPAKRPRNAFAELMSPKKPKAIAPDAAGSYADRHARKHGTPKVKFSLLTNELNFPGRSGLEAYITAPETFPASRVVYYDDRWVLIKDLYPKASVHLLLLSRDLEKSRMHPFEAFEDGNFFREAAEQAEKARCVAASELRRLYGACSQAERARREAMDSEDAPEGEESLPPGRDWGKEVKVGIHSHPSMSNLHIHIISRDMHSECLKHRKHFNSFNTPFLVGLEELRPSDEACEGDAPAGLTAEERETRYQERFLDHDMRCWRCGKNFGNKFARLKEHLEDEWEAWKVE